MSSIAEMFKKPLHSMPKADTQLAIPYAKIGIEVEVENFLVPVAHVPASWEAKPDGSLRNNGMEFVTKGGMVGSEIATAVDSICTFALDKKLSEGYPRAGIHIHLDVTDINAKNNLELARLLQTAMILEPAMFSFAGEHRRACGFCDAFQDSSADFEYISTVLFKWGSSKKADSAISTILREDARYLNKYQAINLLPISRFGTIEFRQLPTTFDPQRIMDWINIILRIKKFSQDFSGDVIALAKKLGGREFFSAVLAEWEYALAKHYTDKGFADGLITAQLIQLQHTVKPFKSKVPKEEWPGKPSSIIARKLKKRSLAKVAAAPKLKVPAAAIRVAADVDPEAIASMISNYYQAPGVAGILYNSLEDAVKRIMAERVRCEGMYRALAEELEGYNDISNEVITHPDFCIAVEVLTSAQLRRLDVQNLYLTIGPLDAVPVLVLHNESLYFNPASMRLEPIL